MRYAWTAERHRSPLYLAAYDVTPAVMAWVDEHWDAFDCVWTSLPGSGRTVINPEDDDPSSVRLGDLDPTWTVREACRWMRAQMRGADEAGPEPPRVQVSATSAALAEIPQAIVFADRDTRARLAERYGDASVDEPGASTWLADVVRMRLQRPSAPTWTYVDEQTNFYVVSPRRITNSRACELPPLIDVDGITSSPVMPIEATIRRGEDSWPVYMGRTATVAIPSATGMRELRVVYVLAPMDAILPSHTPSFARSEGYPAGLQERPYHSDPAEQAKVLRQAAKFRPALAMYASASATDGPPIVTQDGLVVGGNSRAITMRIVQGQRPGEYLAALNDALRDDLHSGLAFAPLPDGEHMIVRMLLEDFDPVTISRQLNQSLTQSVSQRAYMSTIARALLADQMQILAGYDSDSQLTVRAWLRKRARDTLATLRRLGIITEANAADWETPTRGLTPYGAHLVEYALAAAVCSRPLWDTIDFDVFDRLADSTLAALARCALPLWAVRDVLPLDDAGAEALAITASIMDAGPQAARDQLLTGNLFGGDGDELAAAVTGGSGMAFVWGVWWVRASRTPERAAKAIRSAQGIALFGADDSAMRGILTGGAEWPRQVEPVDRAEWIATVEVPADEPAGMLLGGQDGAPSVASAIPNPYPAAVWSTVTGIAQAVLGAELARGGIAKLLGNESDARPTAALRELQREGIVTIRTLPELYALRLALEIEHSLTQEQSESLDAIERALRGDESTDPRMKVIRDWYARHAAQSQLFGAPHETMIGPLSRRHLALLGWGHDPSDPASPLHAAHLAWMRKHGLGYGREVAG